MFIEKTNRAQYTSRCYKPEMAEPQLLPCRQEHLKKKSRDAARCRRGQQNDEYSELASQLPFSAKESSQLDRLSVMRLANSFIKIKHFLRDAAGKDLPYLDDTYDSQVLENELTRALDGFVFVIGDDGQFLYISDNVSQYLGLMPVEVTGNSFYKFIHPCDHEEVAKQLGGKIPLEDMEIFDGLFCSDSIFLMSNNLKGGSSQHDDIGSQPYRSFFVRMKSTLTSRGKSVNLKASTYRVVHCMGCLKLWSPSNASDSKKCQPFCFVGIGVPLMFSPTFEVPLDRCTFTSHHALDLKFLYCEEGIQDILGYSASDVIGQSLYNFHHGVDNDILTQCHKTLLTKGQSVSGYYRILAKYGGWVWVQTKASIVYASKTCQPQFVLCIHYAISDVQKGEVVVSLDQVRRVIEHQDSPTNSPNGKGKYDGVVEKLVSNHHVIAPGGTINLLSKSFDNKSGGQNDIDAGYASPIALSVHEDDDVTYDRSPDSQRYRDADSGCGDQSPPATDQLDSDIDMNPDHFAPFIPPPVGDSEIFADCMAMGSMDESLEDSNLMWNNESWEIYDTDADMRVDDTADMKRNLSTPKFYPHEDDLPILNSSEVEMSTPITNMPLLQGNEIWFALDQGREVTA
ncbi:hypoxia-inducible factor 1-alpha-like isoform X2 [Dendronephthya gigantea]|uniref:hypoxia-inducible factor 1-alpha-like isoform X2 n=1 Tax=Dendronephthya gigantea TaxID=151771 RepID=UPI00106D6A77|nr:hypoxia-inducible factor 1-alpha-like isoform X2 [Dendronephthya gigantea]XP_028393361.1 hypoxia-inducible factor 1-alpha-like isoform X2 [Dendronephthya gigantea]